MNRIDSVDYACNWWLEQIQYPKLNDIGTKNPIEKKLVLLQYKVALETIKNIKPEEFENFKRILDERITLDIETNGISRLEVSYEPVGTLKEAAKEANMSEDIYPLNTCMLVTRDKVELKYATDSTFQQVFYSPEKRY